MTFSPVCTETHHTRQQSTRKGARITHIVLHHAATTNFDQVVRMMTTGSKEVSSHLVVKDSRVAGIVPEELRAWSLSDAAWDGRSLTVETCNEFVTGWTISKASHETLAKIVADWATRYGITPRRSGDRRTWTVLGHREVNSIWGCSYPTACPGAMDLDWIVGRALELMNPPTPALPRRKVKTMLGLRINDGLGRYGEKGANYFATWDGTFFVELSKEDADAVSVHLDAAFANVTYDAWEDYKHRSKALTAS